MIMMVFWWNYVSKTRVEVKFRTGGLHKVAPHVLG